MDKRTDTDRETHIIHSLTSQRGNKWHINRIKDKIYKQFTANIQMKTHIIFTYENMHVTFTAIWK